MLCHITLMTTLQNWDYFSKMQRKIDSEGLNNSQSYIAIKWRSQDPDSDLNSKVHALIFSMIMLGMARKKLTWEKSFCFVTEF